MTRLMETAQQMQQMQMNQTNTNNATSDMNSFYARYNTYGDMGASLEDFKNVAGKSFAWFFFMSIVMFFVPVFLFTGLRVPSELILVFVIALIVILPISYIIKTYNGLVRKRNNVEESFSSMDISLKQRYDLIPNLVRIVKGYATHEKDTLKQVVEARKNAMLPTDKAQQVKDEVQFTQTLKNLFAVVENYPELKADKQFIALQEKLHSIEDQIAVARKKYNTTVKDYNTAIQTFPSNIVANMFHHKKRDMFLLSDVSERENVEIEI